jgi:hypothetical protein
LAEAEGASDAIATVATAVTVESLVKRFMARSPVILTIGRAGDRFGSKRHKKFCFRP